MQALLHRKADEVLTRSGSLAPTTVDVTARTVEVIFSTGAGVPRWDMEGRFLEELSLDPAHVDTKGFVGSSVLDSHRSDSLSSVLGVVKIASANGTEGRATVEFSKRPEVGPIWDDVQAGVIRHVSVGYTVDAYETRKAADGSRIKRATKWRPRELSFVPVPADPGARTRGDDDLPTTTIEPAVPAQNRAEINAQIRSLTQAAGLDAAAADVLIDRNATADEARAALFDQLVTRSTESTVRHQRIELVTSHEEPEKKRAVMEEALVCRMTGKKPSDQARPYMNIRTLDMARELLEARGERGVRYLGPDEVLKRAHGTGDFSALLTGTGNRVLFNAHESATSPIRKLLMRQTTVADFRAKQTLKISGMGALQQVNEFGEITQATRAEAVESYAAKTYAKIFGLTRNALINDDLGAFADFMAVAGRGSAETEASLGTALLTANSGNGATMADGQPLFHSSHGNVPVSGAAIGVTSLDQAFVAMRRQTDLDGVTPLNITPRYLLVAPEEELEALAATSPTYPVNPEDVNPFNARDLKVLVDPHLASGAWRIFADPAQAPVLECAYLASAQGPQISTREGWDVLGMEFRVVLDFGCGVVDHRGAFKNPGP